MPVPPKPADDESVPPPDLAFWDLLRWHLRNGTRSPNSGLRGSQWGITEFGNEVGFSDRQVRNWLDGKSVPRDLERIEEKLFGRDQSAQIEQRRQLRKAFEAAREQERKTPTPEQLADPTPPAKPRFSSNIPITVPRHFLGRDDALAAIDAALKASGGRVAITALHGLRGVGKTVLAAAYAERRREDYRATWWVRAQAPEMMRADLVALGVRLGWVSADAKEEEALARVLARLRDEGEGLLFVYDNAVDAKSLTPFLPHGGATRAIVTSNTHDWRKIAAPVEIRVWPKEIGADFLVARTGRESERADAEALSETLGGLPLAHEQAAAYCERLEISFAEYRRRFAAAPASFLDDAKHAPAEYHDGLTVAKTFALAIDEAAKLHAAAEPLIVYAALLASEPIPLFPPRGGKSSASRLRRK